MIQRLQEAVERKIKPKPTRSFVGYTKEGIEVV
jgi:hypothetical protein